MVHDVEIATPPEFFAVVHGMKDGRDEVVRARLSIPIETSALTADLATATGIPLALGLYQVLDGTAARPGVHSPDAVIDPELVFRDLERTLRLVTTGPAIVLSRNAAPEPEEGDMLSTNPRSTMPRIGLIASLALGLLVSLAPTTPTTTAESRISAAPQVPRYPDRPADLDGGRDSDPPRYTKLPRPNGNGWTVCPSEAKFC
ncbi:hypothetical protein [Nocardia crassostreae]|uniref:hypothetical protein n=1 Tax=Nocardia crassostreae TaxID=53428 RepID=UPI000831E779|nr:hypothetical protein [Nocardia crassostreae]